MEHFYVFNISTSCAWLRVWVWVFLFSGVFFLNCGVHSRDDLVWCLKKLSALPKMLCRPHKSHHTSFMSVFFPVFYYLGGRNASRIFQIQLCVFGKGNQVLLKIMICRLWYSYSGLIGNKIFFLLSAIKILARKTMHWSTVILHCQFSQLLMRWVLRVITCSLVTTVFPLAPIIALSVITECFTFSSEHRTFLFPPL